MAGPDGYGATSSASITHRQRLQDRTWVRKLVACSGLLLASVVISTLTFSSEQHDGTVELTQLQQPSTTELAKAHHKWDTDELRNQVLRIAKLLDKANDYEKKEYASEEEKKKEIADMVSKNISAMLKLHDGIASESVNIKKSFEEEAAKYNANVADDMKVQEGEEKREQFHSRDVQRILITNQGKINWDYLLEQARLAHIAAYKGSVAAHEKIRVNRIDKEEAKGNTEVNEHIQRLMEMIRKNVTVIQKTNADLEKRVHTVNNEEKESFAKALKDVQQQLSDVSKHRQDVIDMSAEIEQVGEGITTMQDDLKKVTQGTTAVQSRASALEDSITTEHDKIKQALSDTEEHIERVRGNLAHLVSLTAQVGDSLKSETDAHERMAKREEDEMGKMKGAVKDMEPQLQTILSLSGDVTELQGQVKTKLQAFEDKYKAIKEKQDGLSSTSATVSDGIKTAMEKLGALEEEDDSGDILSGYKDLKDTLAPVGSELLVVEGLKEEVAAVSAALSSRVATLSSDAASLLQQRSEWETYINSEHTKLQGEMETQIAAEQQRMAAIQAALTGTGTAVNASKAFKARVSQVLGQLKTELKDTSESLLVLDNKYTAQMDAVSKQIQELRTMQGNVANPDAMSQGADEVEVKAEGVLNSLDDMKEEIKRRDAQQKAQADRQIELKKRLQDITKHLTSAITLANNHLKRHPDLIERVSCTCYDGFKLEGHCIAGSMDDKSTCEPCPAGSYCTRGVELPCKTTCPAGQELKGECPVGSSLDTTVCEECPLGVYCTDGARAPCKHTCEAGAELVGDCPAGSVKDTTECRPCPAGFYCADGHTTECQTTCGDGLQLVGVCNEGATEDTTTCEACPADFFCMDGEALPCKKVCDDGKVLKGSCPAGSTSDTTTCEECPAGFYCQAGEAIACKDTCEPGLLLEGACAAGSKRDTIKCKTCPRDMFCVNGVPAPCKTTCDAGEYLTGECRRGSGSDLTECVACEAGFYCTDGKKDRCRDKCLNGLELIGSCPEKSSEDTSTCEPCPAGFYCRDGFPKKECRNTCPAGQLLEGACAEGSKRDVTRCTWCDRGFFCQDGVAHACKTECPDGKVLSGTCGKASTEDTTTCEPCPGGKYCAGGQVKDCKTTCPDGQYLDGFCEPGSTEDTTVCKTCPEGSFCKDGRKMECASTCRPGQELVGKCEAGSTEHVTHCEPCSKGHYCGGTDGKAMDCTASCIDGKQLRGECLRGEKKDAVECVPCPEGLFCADGLTKPCKTTCDPGGLLIGHCHPGSLQDTTSCTPCPEGSFCVDGVAHRCKATCDPGLQLNGHCSLGSKKDVTTCDPCPPGFWCREGRPYACKSQCPPGQSLDGECKEGSSEDLDCIPCPSGNFCAGGKTTSCKSSCPDGKELVGFCTAGSDHDTSACHDCPAGSWCTGGEARPCRTQCEEGKELQGTCPSGSKEDITTCEACEAGFFCQQGKKFECRATCPNGKLLSAGCPAGAKEDVVTCDPCPAGSFCTDGVAHPCKMECEDGSVLGGSCGVGSALDTMTCDPCPSGFFCVGGTQEPCKTTCEDGKELVGFCSAGSTEDTTQCNPCPQGSFCKDGIATPCRSTCPAGEVFGGECAAGSSVDATTCSECSAGFFCQNGIQTPCKTQCPSPIQEMRGECKAGSVEDTVECVSAGTPPPAPVKWWTLRTEAQNTEPPSSTPHGVSMLRLTSGSSGFVQGSMPLPVPSASWTLQFYIGWPAYDAGEPANEAGFPTQNVGAPGKDTIKISINGKEQTVSTSDGYAGKMQVIMMTVEADSLIFRFDFTSTTTDPALHPFIAAGEVTLNHDATTDENGVGFGEGKGEFKGKCVNAINGKTVKPEQLQHDGYEKNAFAVAEEPTVLLFKDTTLIAKIPISKGKYRVRKIAPGKYACIGVAKGFMAFFNDACEVTNTAVFYMDTVFSPWLRPGELRAILIWGELPRDMDSYLLVPHKDHEEPPCEVSWISGECHSGGAELDYDVKSSYGPETITIKKFREGKYRYRVAEYKGKEDNREVLLNSRAQVTVHTESMGARFVVAKDGAPGDGFIKGRDWYVFTIDGTTRRILPCTPDTCGSGYHDPKGLGNG